MMQDVNVKSKSGIAMAKAAFKKTNAIFNSKLHLNVMKKCYI